MVRIARLAALAIATLCAVVLLGYATHFGVVVDLGAGWQGVSPITALALLCLAVIAFLDDSGRGRLIDGLAWSVVAIGAASLVSEAMVGQDIVDPFIASKIFLFNQARAGRMSAATAIALVLLACAGLARDKPKVSDRAAALALVIALFALLGYAYGVRDLYGVPLFTTMALQTAASIFVLALARLIMRPETGWAAIVASPREGGRAVRRLLAFTLLPPVAAFVLLVLTQARRLGPGAAMAGLVVITVVPLSLLILREGRTRDELERERRTRAKQRQDNLREIELVTNALPVLIAFLDKTLTYRFANSAYEDWFYLRRDEVIGRSVIDLLDAEGFTHRRAFFEKALAGEEQRFELSWPHRDGRPRDADIHYLPRIAADGEVEGLYVFVADITDRKQVERRLTAVNAMLEQRVEARTRERDQIWLASKDMLCVASLEGFFLSLNPAWSTTLGWSETEMKSRPFLDFVHPDDLETSMAAARGLAEGEAQLSYENRYRHKNGDYLWLSWNAVPRDGIIYASVRDVTQAKEAALREQALEEQLRQSQKMEAVGQLTGGLAHDFNNLLTGITGSLDMLSARVSRGRVNDLERFIDAAQGAARRAAALTHRLLAFSRRQTLDPKPTDTDRLVAGMEDLLRRTVGPAIVLEIKSGGGLWTILADPNQIENALLNLCINARDAMPDGGRIIIETTNTMLDGRASRERDLPPGPYVALSVTDTGTGMPPDVVERVFDPFYTTKPLGQGTGLGLSMIYGFARQSGGQIWIQSEVGQGTTMSLYLPRHDGAAEIDEAPATVIKTERAERGGTVLVVDDEPSIRMLVSEVLEDQGYTTIEAADSVAGLKILHSSVAIDLLVTDVGLPGGMNGRQVADAGRAVRPGLKILFITGYAKSAVIGNERLERGMRVLTKPFAMEGLGRLVKEMIEGA